MLDPGEFNPIVYWLHVVLGFGSAGFALLALVSSKGGIWHRRSGLFFSVSMGIAAVTALVFFAEAPAPPVLISSLAALYGIGMAILSLKQRSGLWKVVQWALVLVPSLLALLYMAYIGFALTIPEVPLYLAVLGPAAGVIFGAMAWGDIRFLRTSQPDKSRRLKRHAIRMALVAVEVVRAPAISFGPPFMGDATFDLYSFGPFLLIPLVYFLAMPDWLKRDQAGPTDSQAV